MNSNLNLKRRQKLIVQREQLIEIMVHDENQTMAQEDVVGINDE
tara:strand:- start:83 stop:214 length:132 start_codon:yes stop_codon:yes gene_type:complete